MAHWLTWDLAVHEGHPAISLLHGAVRPGWLPAWASPCVSRLEWFWTCQVRGTGWAVACQDYWQQRHQRRTEGTPVGQGCRGGLQGQGTEEAEEGKAQPAEHQPGRFLFYCRESRRVHITGKGSAWPVSSWARPCSHKWVKMSTLGVQAQTNITWIVFKNVYVTLINIM